MKLTYSTPIILALSLIANIANIAQAQMLDLSFQKITSNNTENIEDQLGASVYDQAQALLDFSSTSSENIASISAMKSNEVLFTFTNTAGTNSNLSEVFFDDGTIFSQTSILNSLGGYTHFSDGGKNGINPGNLPGGNTITPVFEATADFGADTQGNAKNGVNSSDDILGIIIKLQSGLGFNELQQSLVDGTLRLGSHVRSIGAAGGSDSFINNPFNDADLDPSLVPIPAAMWLFGPALLALPGVIRRKSV